MASASDLEFGVMLSATSNDYGIADEERPEIFRRTATAVEENGFDVLVAGDHIAYPDEIPSDYEFSQSGEPPFDSDTSVYDVFQVLSHLAAITDDIALGTNVCAAPYRHPITLTKHVLTLESLSGGRADLGVAPGWLHTEFEALGVPFEERGSRTDEFLDIFRRACEEERLSYDGDHASFDTVGFHPSPSREIPVWIGGHSGATFRRIAEYGNGWTTLWDRPDDVEQARDRILNAWTDYDRDGEPEIAVLRPVNVGGDGDRILSGSADEIIDDLESYAAAGATRVIVDFYTTDVDEQLEQIRRLGEDVLPSF
ncbi:Luciferase-like, subgroup (plasmid) [Haloterrigena turkmenica DSM 5511]|uniref:Luciferase-like, subgroup n=1 Tax=Haloterrigena turkmenica (strain ATCC 51198 / DSM 5511 / JCM 9101 / NCIMB 13204 / VKM B-1734 / 4k) TaxID=543526 RepID=D2S1I3_HALTV|nr:TIGR03619 family F420-dependent LLM class oxidoreductase [Haloterrigena turkmenica]ADB63230.1 Luciferase-like, subgroup [Haloterrigena turkmenica DSM 5511]